MTRTWKIASRALMLGMVVSVLGHLPAAALARPGTDPGENDRLKSVARENRKSNKPTDKDPDQPTNPAATPLAEAPPEASQTPDAGNTADLVSDQPRIVFEKTDHDFGVVREHESLPVTFRFRNLGRQSLVIEKVNTGCGCTVAALDKNEYGPGESGEIKITYNPKSAGKATRSIQVLSNDPDQRAASLTIGANVVPVVSADPPNVQFGQVSIGSERSAELQIISRDPKVKILSIETNGPEIEAHLIENPVRKGVIDPNLPGFASIQVSLRNSAAVGRLLRSITIKTEARENEGDASPAQQELKINVFASIKGDLTVQPPFLRFPPLKANEDFEREVLLTRAGGKAFKVTDVKVVNSTMPVEARAEPVQNGSGFRIVVSGKAGQLATNFRGTIQVTTDVEKEPVTEIQFSGLVRAAQ